MHPAPAGAPPLLVPAAHGYLLGFFPVNAVHSIFHFSVGVLGLAAFIRSGWALAYVRTFAVVLAALTVMGLVPGLNSLFGLARVSDGPAARICGGARVRINRRARLQP